MDIDAINKKIEQLGYYRDIRNYEKSIELWLELIQEMPTNPQFWRGLAKTYINAGDRTDACINACFEGLKYETDPVGKASILSLLAHEYDFMKNYEEAESYHKAALEIDSSKASYFSSYARNLACLGRKDEAEEMMATAVSMAPDDYYVLVDQLQFYSDFYPHKETERAILSRMLELSSDPFRMNIYMGNFHYQYEEYEEAYDFFVKAVLINPNHKDLNDNIAFLENRFKFKEISQAMPAGLEEEESAMLDSFSKSKDYRAANRYCDNLQKKYGNKPDLLYYKATVSNNIGLYRESIAASLQLKGTDLENYSLYTLGTSYFNLKRYHDALPVFHSAVKFNPRHMSYQIGYARCLAELGQVDEALSFIKESVHYANKKTEMSYCLFIILYKFKDDMQSELNTVNDIINTLVYEGKNASESTDMWNAWVMCALAYEKYEQISTAVEYIRKAVDHGLNDKSTLDILNRMVKSKKRGNKYGRIGVFTVFAKKKTGRQTYPLSNWEIL